MRSIPDLQLEQLARDRHGALLVAGLDEAGRGAIAGPVVAAAVVLPLDNGEIVSRLEGVNDSKQLSPSAREALYETVIANALTYAIGESSAEVIDEIGIIPANAMAMTRAVSLLVPQPEYLLLDGRMKLRNLPLRQQSVIRGDTLSLSVAAASILAKVHRDRIMAAVDESYPEYGFARHKGYCTREHVAALERSGPCPIHRYSFAPLRLALL